MDNCNGTCTNCRECEIRARLKPEMIYRPVPQANDKNKLLFAEGCAITTLTSMRGLMLNICAQLGHPMVVLQKKFKEDECKGCVTWEQAESSRDDLALQYDRLESKIFYEQGPSVCRYLREPENGGDGFCRALDAFMAEALLEHNKNHDEMDRYLAKPFVYDGVDHGVIIHRPQENEEAICRLYYKCPRSGYCETAHLIDINGVRCVVILGQLLFTETEGYKHLSSEEQVGEFIKKELRKTYTDNFDLSLLTEGSNDKPKSYLQKRLDEMKDHKIDTADEGTASKQKPFIEVLDLRIKELIANLKAMYEARSEKVIKQIVSQTANDFLTQVNNVYEEHKKTHPYSEPSEFLGTLFEKVADAFKTMLAQSESEKPTSSTEDDHPTIQQYLGFRIKKNDITIKFEGRNSEDGFVPAIEPPSTKSQSLKGTEAFHEAEGYFEYYKSITGTQMPEVRMETDTSFWELLNSDSENKEKNMEVFQNDLFAPIYDQFALVCACLNYRFSAEYLRVFIASMRHELAQLHKGHLDIQSELTDKLNKLTDDMHDKTVSLGRPDVDSLLQYYHQYLHASLLRVNSTRYISLIPEPAKGTFRPYGRFFYKWRATYMAASEFNKYNQLYFETPIGSDDPNFPEMYSDSDLMEQVAYNLTENAFKYARKGTRIVIDCRVTSDKQWYELTVTNYGYAISEDDFVKLKGYSFRASINSYADIQGSGMGLWYCDRVLRRLGGELDIKRDEVSDFDIEGLMLYDGLDEVDQVKVQKFLELRTPGFDVKKFHENTKDAMRKLDKSVFRTDMLPELLPQKLDNPFTPMSVAFMIMKKTWKYTFIARIPNK